MFENNVNTINDETIAEVASSADTVTAESVAESKPVVKPAVAPLSANREIQKAINEERVFSSMATRSVPNGDFPAIPVQVPLSVRGNQSLPGLITYKDLDADTNHPNPARLIGMRISYVIIGVDDEKGILLCSRKIAQQIAKVKMVPDLASQKPMDGVVTGFTDFGAFVDVDGVVGLLRNADYSTDHSRVNERYKIGDKISVKCKKVSNDEQRRITWEAVTKYRRTTPYECDLESGAIVLGRVIDIKNFPQSQAVFVRLEDNQSFDVLCSMPEDIEIEKNTSVVVRITSVDVGVTEFARPRIRGRILRLA